jgi:DNA-binding NarL/FixJ family response regulator
MNTLESLSILAIDDEPVNLMMLEVFLRPRCRQLWLETDIDSALVLAQTQKPDIILLDILMEKMDGYEVCQHLKANIDTAHIPVIFLSSLASAVDKVKAFQLGGVDYISKPFDIDEVIIRVENCMRWYQQVQQKQGVSASEKTEKINISHLSTRELEILKLYALGTKRSEIAEQLCISSNTVKSNLQRLFTKLNINNRVQAIEKAREMGLT